MLADVAGAGMAMQVEEDAATRTAQQQTQLLQESHASITAAVEQVAAHGEPLAPSPSTFHQSASCSPITRILTLSPDK